MKQFIYFAQTGDAIKIGVTIDLKQRLSELQCGCPTTIKYIYTMPLNKDGITEEGLHEKFSSYRLRGEWYKAQPILACLPLKISISQRAVITTVQEMDRAWDIKMEGEVDRLILEHRNRFK